MECGVWSVELRFGFNVILNLQCHSERSEESIPLFIQARFFAALRMTFSFFLLTTKPSFHTPHSKLPLNPRIPHHIIAAFRHINAVKAAVPARNYTLARAQVKNLDRQPAAYPYSLGRVDKRGDYSFPVKRLEKPHCPRP